MDIRQFIYLYGGWRCFINAARQWQMGKTKGRYNAEHTKGSNVRVVEKGQLEQFKKDWKYHHPLQPFQLQYAGYVAKVANVTFYHGGDELYELVDVPRIWHEECLNAVGAANLM